MAVKLAKTRRGTSPPPLLLPLPPRPQQQKICKERRRRRRRRRLSLGALYANMCSARSHYTCTTRHMFTRKRLAHVKIPCRRLYFAVAFPLFTLTRPNNVHICSLPTPVFSFHVLHLRWPAVALALVKRSLRTAPPIIDASLRSTF